MACPHPTAEFYSPILQNRNVKFTYTCPTKSRDILYFEISYIHTSVGIVRVLLRFCVDIKTDLSKCKEFEKLLLK